MKEKTKKQNKICDSVQLAPQYERDKKQFSLFEVLTKFETLLAPNVYLVILFGLTFK